MKGRDRNWQCWCGSGKKYKHCHLDRETQRRGDPWAAVAANKKAFTQKKCFAANVGLGPCESTGKIIKAHTVSRSANLSKIAESGHVIRYSANIAEMNKNGGKLSAGLVGTRDASVFFGFCSKHDSTIFSCIETELFTGRPDQCLAIAYRTMSRELYGKDAASHIPSILRDADKGRSAQEQIIIQSLLRDIEVGNSAARREAAHIHGVLTKAIVNNTPEVLESMIVTFDGPLPFMVAGAWSPFTDLYGANLQDGFADQILEQVFFSTFAKDACGIICISWRKTDRAPGKLIADQIESLAGAQQASACLQIIAKHIENIFYRPSWFNALDPKLRRQLDLLTFSGCDFVGSVPSVAIDLSLGFILPNANGAYRV